MTPSAARLALVCALVGLGASAAAAYVHYRLLYDPRYLSFCDINTTVSCTQVYLSRFSTVGGVPVALFGAFGFALSALLSLSALVGGREVRESAPGYLFVLSTLSLAVILYLGYTSFFILKAVCLLCLITYAAVIGLFVVSGAATSVPMTTLPRRARRDVRLLASSPLAIALTVLFLGGTASAIALFPREGTPEAAAASQGPAPTPDQRSEFERWFASQPRVPIIEPLNGAKVLVIKFNDFQCPPCRQSYTMYKSIFAKYEAEQPGAVRLVLKDYPLSSECNNNVVGSGPHPAACQAAVAVRLARFHNRGDAMEEWLFANQPAMTPALARQGAHDVGQVNDFEAKFATTIELVKGDIALGRTLGVRSTPTFFVNGVKVEGALPPQYFDQAIAYELQRAKGQ